MCNAEHSSTREPRPVQPDPEVVERLQHYMAVLAAFHAEGETNLDRLNFLRILSDHDIDSAEPDEPAETEPASD